MNSKYLLFIGIITLFFSDQIVIAQNRRLFQLYKKANQKIKNSEYPKAMALYKKIINIDSMSADAHYKIGEILLFDYDFEGAYCSFEKSCSLIVNHRPFLEGYYFVSNYALNHKGNYEMALRNATSFLNSCPNSKDYAKKRSDMRSLVDNCNYALSKTRDREQNDYNLKMLAYPFNEFTMQYFPSLTGDGKRMYFTTRNIASDENIFTSYYDGSEWTIPSLVKSINTDFLNEGAASISANDELLTFTICNNRYGTTIGSCDIFVSHRKSNDLWSRPKNIGIPINSPAWESQPSLSIDGRIIYFSSNRPGGIGGKDIWCSEKDSLSNWGNPINLGPSINTKNDEIAPYLYLDSRSIYFSSNRKGFGGFDIYRSEKEEENWKKPENLGYPFNDHSNQIGITFSSNGEKGYVTIEKMQKDRTYISHIYSFSVPPEFQPSNYVTIVSGTIYDLETNKPISNSLIQIFDANQYTEHYRSYTKDDGSYLAFLTQKTNYSVFISKLGYLFKSLYLDIKYHDSISDLKQDIYLSSINETSNVIELNNLLFESGSSTIDTKGKLELDKLSEFFNYYKRLCLSIEAHTDDIGSEIFNKHLSEKRGKEVKTHLTNKGISLKELL